MLGKLVFELLFQIDTLVTGPRDQVLSPTADSCLLDSSLSPAGNRPAARSRPPDPPQRITGLEQCELDARRAAVDRDDAQVSDFHG